MTTTTTTKQKICKRSLISGRVQGVSFRYYTCRKAIALGLTGTVRNLPDGRVEAVIQGDQPLVEAMSYWLWEGSPESHVEFVESEIQDLQGFDSFAIRY